MWMVIIECGALLSGKRRKVPRNTSLHRSVLSRSHYGGYLISAACGWRCVVGNVLSLERCGLFRQLNLKQRIAKVCRVFNCGE